MHAMSVYIAREQFIHHQTVERMQARSEDLHTHVLRALLHTCVFMKFKSSCTKGVKLSVHHYHTHEGNSIRLMEFHLYSLRFTQSARLASDTELK